MGVLIEREGPAVVVTLDWPERRNALGPDEATALSAALREAAAAPDIAGLVLTGSGAFCAGGDLKGAASRSGMPEEERRQLVYSAFQGLMRALLAVPVPTVAAMDGPAIGLGFDLALACDSRFIGPQGWCQQGWGRVGFVPGTGGVLLLQHRAPGLLWSLLEQQPRLDAAAAARLNLAEDASGQDARSRAVARVAGLAAMPRASLEAYVALSRDALRREMEAHLALAVEHQLKLLASPAVIERVAAILGKKS